MNAIGWVLLFASLPFASDLLVSSSGSGAVLRYDGETGAFLVDETVTADSWRLANPGQGAEAVEMKVWLGVPGFSNVLDRERRGRRLVGLSRGFRLRVRPRRPVRALSGFPLGTYEFSCRLLDPVTGETVSEDLNFFEVQ